MKQTLPDIDDLIEGINDSDTDPDTDSLLNGTSTASSVEGKTEKDSPSDKVTDNLSESSADCWNIFLGLTDEPGNDSDRDMRLVCKIDRELADTLDECDIDGLCRSDLVNRIVRAFLKTYLDRMVKFKKNRKSLFKNVGKG